MTPKHQHVAAAEITSNREKSLTSQRNGPYQANRRTPKLREIDSRPPSLQRNPSRSPSRSTVVFTTKFRQNRRTPKNYVNSTPVPALVPAQYDGSGGPWQVRRSHGIFRQIDERTTLKSILPLESTHCTWNSRPTTIPSSHLWRKFFVTMNITCVNIPHFWQYFHLVFSNFDLICFSNFTKILGGHVRYANIALLL